MAAKAGMKSLCRHRMSNRSSPIPKRTTDCNESIADKYDANFKAVRLHVKRIGVAQMCIPCCVGIYAISDQYRPAGVPPQIPYYLLLM